MKVLSAVALAGLLLAAHAQAADVGVSIHFSQPGVFGRVDIGNLPVPQLIVPQPVFIAPPPVGMPPPEPVYMWVPPEHRQDWREHCREYHACDHPVYFVHDDWYRRNVAQGHGRRGQWHDERRGEVRDEGHGNGRADDRGDHEHGHDGDHGNHDRGHGRD